MPRSRHWRDDAGSASVEFVTAGLLLLVPVVYLVIAMAAIQAGAFAAEGAARQAARVFVQSATPDAGRAAVERVVRFALADFGVEAADVDVSITCAPRPADCLERHGFVTVDVAIAVALPLVPAAIMGEIPLAVTLEASATQQVSRFRDDG